MSEYVGSRERAKQFRKMLKAEFPGTKFSVRCDTGTAYNWINVHWEDGPSVREVRDLIGPLHKDLAVERKYSRGVQAVAARLLADHHPELQVYTSEGEIDWNTETYRTPIVIGQKTIRNQTMHSVISEIAEHYVLGDGEPFPLPEKDPVLFDGLDSDDQNVLEHKFGDRAREEYEERGRLTRGNPFVLGMHPGEKPHLDVRRVTPFEAVLTTVPDVEEGQGGVDLTPREITALSPLGRSLSIFSVPALVMADTDGYMAGELVWVGKTISAVLDETDRVLVSRGDDHPLQPVTTNFLMLI